MPIRGRWWSTEAGHRRRDFQTEHLPGVTWVPYDSRHKLRAIYAGYFYRDDITLQSERGAVHGGAYPASPALFLFRQQFCYLIPFRSGPTWTCASRELSDSLQFSVKGQLALLGFVGHMLSPSHTLPFPLLSHMALGPTHKGTVVLGSQA